MLLKYIRPLLINHRDDNKDTTASRYELSVQHSTTIVATNNSLDLFKIADDPLSL